MNNAPGPPLVSYYGGKQRIARHIVAALPPHTVYAEPFAGGLAVLYAKGRSPVTNGHHYREAINDTNRVLITLYRVAKLQPDELARQLDATLCSKADHDRARSICKEPAGYDEITVAWAAYVNSMVSFASTWGGGYSRGVIGDNHAAKWAQKLDTLQGRMARLRDVCMDCIDALDFIDRWDAPHTVFYCDPPYPNTDQRHYGGYTLDDFAALVDRLATCKASFVLSNYHQDVPMPGDWRRVEIQARMSAPNGKHELRTGGDTHRTEVLWIKDRSGDTRPDLRRHLWSPSLGLVNQRQNGHAAQMALAGVKHDE